MCGKLRIEIQKAYCAVGTFKSEILMNTVQSLIMHGKPDPENPDAGAPLSACDWVDLGQGTYEWRMSKFEQGAWTQSEQPLNESGRRWLLEHYGVSRAAHQLSLVVLKKVGPTQLSAFAHAIETSLDDNSASKIQATMDA